MQVLSRISPPHSVTGDAEFIFFHAAAFQAGGQPVEQGSEFPAQGFPRISLQRLQPYGREFRQQGGAFFISGFENFLRAGEFSQAFVRNFGSSFENLFFYGDTGVGKTFLSHCIARELIEQSFCVIYFTAFDLFDLFARYTFSSSEEAKDAHANIFDCDLLIIDDLGTELTNSFVSSQLFLCINERILRKKSTIISTNLPLDRFMETYSERTFSRISSNYTIIKLFGNDIRIQKKLLGGTKA